MDHGDSLSVAACLPPAEDHSSLEAVSVVLVVAAVVRKAVSPSSSSSSSSSSCSRRRSNKHENDFIVQSSKGLEETAGSVSAKDEQSRLLRLSGKGAHLGCDYLSARTCSAGKSRLGGLCVFQLCGGSPTARTSCVASEEHRAGRL